MERAEILKEIRNIVGNKCFYWSDAYIDNRGLPELGQERGYNGITRKYVYVPCFLSMGWNEDETEFGAIIQKYPICYKRNSGKYVNKVELDDLFTRDLDNILDDIKFYLLWEFEHRLPRLQNQINGIEKLRKMYEKVTKE